MIGVMSIGYAQMLINRLQVRVLQGPPTTSPRDGMVDITDLKSVADRRAGSSPAAGTKGERNGDLRTLSHNGQEFFCSYMSCM